MNPSRPIATKHRALTLALIVCAAADPANAQQGPAMSDATTTVRAQGTVLDVRIALDRGPSSATVTYTVRNEGAHALAVFDRGTTLDITSKRLHAGAVAAPSRQVLTDGIGLSHLALALPRPAPTVPRISLAARVDAGKTLEGHFSVELEADTRRVRYCLGIADFDEATFTAFASDSPIALWRVPFAIAATQTNLCTPFYVVQTQTFEDR